MRWAPLRSTHLIRFLLLASTFTLLRSSAPATNTIVYWMRPWPHRTFTPSGTPALGRARRIVFGDHL